jgi:DNA invertase Pin-like site-specific DNA recombinase
MEEITKQKRQNRNGKETALPVQKNIIGYLRVSTGDQDLQNQKHGILELANKNGWKVEFREEKVSGKISYKERMLGSIVENLQEGDILLVSELSRLGRSMLEIMTLLGELSLKGIKVYSVKGNHELNGDSIQSKIITMVFCMASEIERDLISLRTKEALKRKKDEGVKLGRPKGPGKSKLDVKIEEIRNLYDKKVSVASLGKIYNCSWPTMSNFIQKKVVNNQ